MRKAMRQLALSAAVATHLAACGDDWRPAFDETIGPEQLDTVAIVDLDTGLTFARIDSGERRQLIAVRRYRSATIEGVDLTATLGADDPISLFRERAYDGLRDAILAAPPAARVTVPVRELGVPVDLGDHHIAAGTNYVEHADDAGTVHPFLFPKLVRPTPAYAAVSAGTGLLDYEVELAFVTLEALAQGNAPGAMGLILCNDYTDRATLMYGIDSGDIESGKGFATGKSFPGYLPVGNLFVIPRDFRAFANDLQLRLFVDHGLRQRAGTREMVWNIDEILKQTWARKDVRWEHRGQQVSLFGESEAIPARTLIMSGTPHGTVFNGLPTQHMIAGLLAWLAGGWDKSIPHHVIAAYVDAARSARAYLQPGDRVAIHVDHLGVIHNEIR